MRFLLNIAALILISFGCSQSDVSERRADFVFINGEKVKANPSPNRVDSQILQKFLFDTSYSHNLKVKALEGDGLIRIPGSLEMLHKIQLDIQSKHTRTYTAEELKDPNISACDTLFGIDQLVSLDLNGDDIKDYFVSVGDFCGDIVGYFYNGLTGDQITSDMNPHARFHLNCHVVDVICGDQKDELLLTRGISTYGSVLELYRYNDSTQQIDEIYGFTYDLMVYDPKEENQGVTYSNLFDYDGTCIDTLFETPGKFISDTLRENMVNMHAIPNKPKAIFTFNPVSGKYLNVSDSLK